MKHSRRIMILSVLILTLAHFSEVAAVGVSMTMTATAAVQRSRVKRRQTTRKVASARIGMWGGAHVALSVGEDGARIEYDCANGTIEQPIHLDRHGRFDVRGTHERQAGGPVRIDAPTQSQPARYVGRIVGTRMTLNVTLVKSGESVGTFTLKHGVEPRLFRCY